MGLQNKNVIVTGGSRGIGRATVELLMSKGANVFFTYKDDIDSATSLEELSKDYVGNAKAYKVDIINYNEVLSFASDYIQTYGTIDVLINNAGIRKDRTLLYMDKEDWDDVVHTNLTGVFNMTKAFLPYMLKNRSGRIINLSSVSGISGLSGQTNYSSTKAGIIGFTKALAKEIASFHICVNAIAPGPVETDMLNGLSQSIKSKLLANIPIKRMCKPVEVAMTMNFLADDELSPPYLTGQVITLDGGMGL